MKPAWIFFPWTKSGTSPLFSLRMEERRSIWDFFSLNINTLYPFSIFFAMSADSNSKFLLKTGWGDMSNFITSSLSTSRGTSRNTFLKGSVSLKKSSLLYMSEESAQTTVPLGNSWEILIRFSSLSEERSGNMSILSRSSFESWVLQSNTWILSTSFPKNDILKG